MVKEEVMERGKRWRGEGDGEREVMDREVMQ